MKFQSTAAMPSDLPSPARTLDDLAREERSFTFTHFTCVSKSTGRKIAAFRN